MGGWHELSGLRRMKIRFKSDERILGDSDFVERVLHSASEAMERRYRLKAEGYTFKERFPRNVDHGKHKRHENMTVPKTPRFQAVFRIDWHMWRRVCVNHGVSDE